MLSIHRKLVLSNISIRFLSTLTSLRNGSNSKNSSSAVFNNQLRFINQDSIVNRILYKWKGPGDAEWRRRDGLPDHYKLVYKATSANYVKMGAAAMPSSAVGLVALALYELFYNDWRFFTEFHSDKIILMSTYAAMIYAFNSILKMYPYRIYYSESEDIFAVTLFGWNFRCKKILKIKPNSGCSVKKSVIAEQLFVWLDEAHSFEDGVRLILVRENFVTPYYHHKMLKIDSVVK